MFSAFAPFSPRLWTSANVNNAISKALCTISTSGRSAQHSSTTLVTTGLTNVDGTLTVSHLPIIPATTTEYTYIQPQNNMFSSPLLDKLFIQAQIDDIERENQQLRAEIIKIQSANKRLEGDIPEYLAENAEIVHENIL
ncbi:hypothetical protein BX661DRAFT_208271 [Kickxella alabastrina]|uniref:uncharacterized protein n=1 Tax=Kickxella alabastrina TaxID=61397 RepID=UPI0022205492|nr:uncharacterized protein BX661DRAFT_208271 [Kickxella alabastrina]KAI7819192.1 hypothetical protein BX661DRAFT_208271 [Kickxella alabastrina]